MVDKMTPETAAYRLFDMGFDCAQTVLAHFADDLDLEEETALMITSAFGGGIAGTGNMCGCVTGALMALGMKYGFTEPDAIAKNIMTAKNNEFLAKFKERCGAINCRELLGVDVSDPEQAAEAPERIQARCPHFVTAACDILEEMLED
ncbi:MAG: C_GCAxxG_C_C family protein [Oscillospiraceae bacterium]|nr:C_GCAxxG_C_C family protein [Oscillospiraceae bacterium]